MDDSSVKKTIKEISISMEKKGYDPVNQIVGYIISNDLGYIPDFDDNRNKISEIDRTVLVENMLKDYLRWDIWD